MLDQKINHTGWTLWFQWVLLSSLGWLLVSNLASWLYEGLDEYFPSTALSICLTLVMGAGLALIQWLVLRQFFTGVKRWTVASSLGMTVGGWVALPIKLWDLYLGPSGFQLDELLYGTVFGLFLGGAQWLVMRKWVKHAWWWVLSSAAGWTLGMAIGELIPSYLNSTRGELIYWMGTEGIPTVFTGLALVLLLRYALDTAPILGVDQDAG